MNATTILARHTISEQIQNSLIDRGISINDYDVCGAVAPSVQADIRVLLLPRKGGAPAGPNLWLLVGYNGDLGAAYPAHDGITVAGIETGLGILARQNRKVEYYRPAGETYIVDINTGFAPISLGGGISAVLAADYLCGLSAA